MINDIILLKQGEIVLKGLNRRSFEQKLMSNIKRRLDAIGKFKAYCMQSTVYIEPVDETSDMDAAFEAMTKVFGLASGQPRRRLRERPEEDSRACHRVSQGRYARGEKLQGRGKAQRQELSDDEHRACAVCRRRACRGISQLRGRCARP